MRAARGWLVALVAVVAVVVLVVVASASERNDGPPLDPASTAPDGTRALTELIGRFGPPLDVREGLGESSYGRGDVLLVLEDGLEDGEDGRLEDAARRGARVVVAAEGAAGPAIGADPEQVVRAGRCSLAWPGVERVQGFTAALLTEGSGAAVDGVCFSTGGTAFVLRRQVGLGEWFAVGGPQPFTNRYLAEQDNAVLATALLLDGGTVHLVRPRPFSTGDQSLFDLLPAGFYRLLVQLAVALVLFVWASAVRLGRPVREPLLLELPATSFTDSVAQLYQRGGRRALAAGWLRRRARRELLHRYQLPPDAGVEELAAVLAKAAGHPEHADRYAAVLRDNEPGSSEELLDVAASIDRLRREVIHGSS